MKRRAVTMAAVVALSLTAGAVAWAQQPGHASGPQAFVVNMGSGTVTPVRLAASAAGVAIKVGRHPDAIAATPDGKTVYVANAGSGSVTPISTTTDTARRPIRVGADPVAIAISPRGRAAYVVDKPLGKPGTVVPIRIRTGTVGRPIRVGGTPVAIVLTPDGRTALVINQGNGNGNGYLTPISTRTNKAGKPIRLPVFPYAIAMAPGGRMAYVAGAGRMVLTPQGEAWQGVLVPIRIRTLAKGRPIVVGHDLLMGNEAPTAVVFNRSGSMAYAVYTAIDALVPVNTVTGHAAKPIPVAGVPVAAVSVRGGRSIYVASLGPPDLTMVNPAARTRKVINAGPGPAGPPSPVLSVITASRDGKMIYVLNWNGTAAGTMTPVRVRTNAAEKLITVGANPVAMVIVP
jgi:YVTN family beta-propeller protein